MKQILRLLIIISIFTVSTIYAETAFSINSPSGICSAVTNDTVKIYVYDFYKNKNVEVGKVAGGCSNTAYYNTNLSNKQSGDTYPSWTWHGRASSSTKYYIENVEKKKADYQYFVISNRAQKYNSTTGNLERLYTLKPGEKIFMTADLGSSAFASTKYNDARIVVEYGETSSDMSIISRSSMGFYVIGSDNKTYGPFRIDDYSLEQIVMNVAESGSQTKVRRYKLISENILTGIPSGVNVKTIKIVPYDFYNIRGGNFNIYKLSVEGYSSAYTKSKNTVSVNNAESVVRHNVTNNMIDISTLRWEIDPNAKTTLNFYHHYNTGNPIIYKNNRTIYYGIPYVNSFNSTIESFTTNGKKGKDKNNKDIFQIYLPTKYTKTTTSTKGNTITEGNSFPNNQLYVVEKHAKNDEKGTRKTQLATYDYITNQSYFFGLDCSSSTYLAEGMAVPAVNSMALSNRYSTSAEIELLGSVKVDNKAFEKYIRDNNKLKSSEQLTDDTYNTYYFEHFKKLNTMDAIYDSYALAIPGDIIAKRGHVRMESGYPYVVCKDGTHKTQKYSKNYCKNYGGIDPDKSYVITTEIGGANATNQATGYVAESNTGWSFTVNSKYTNLTNIDQIRNQTVNYKINKKYTFTALTDTGYMAFRYKSMSDIMSTSKVEVPIAKVVGASTSSNLSSTKELKGTIITNYLIQEIKFVVNGETYIVNPYQTTYYSLYYDTPAEVKNAIKTSGDEIDVKVYVKQGPNITSVQEAASQDSNNFGEVLSVQVTAPTPPEDPPGVEIDDPTDPPEDEKPPGEGPIPESDEDDPDGQTEGEGEDPGSDPATGSESGDNPGTGGIISTVFIGTLLLMLIIMSLYQNKYNKIKRI